MDDKERIKELETKVALYERSGGANLFYALNRKMNEISIMLNKHNLNNLDLTDAKDKTFERLKIAWNEGAGIANAMKALGEIAGITNDESKDTLTPKYRLTPESISDVLGNTAGQIN